LPRAREANDAANPDNAATWHSSGETAPASHRKWCALKGTDRTYRSKPRVPAITKDTCAPSDFSVPSILKFSASGSRLNAQCLHQARTAERLNLAFERTNARRHGIRLPDRLFTADPPRRNAPGGISPTHATEVALTRMRHQRCRSVFPQFGLDAALSIQPRP